uniref:Uncharacterized protein n=1 Tax=Dromaius novaehollandiae TaxID=8790 RepID=A0A8C4KUN7_DRONO
GVAGAEQPDEEAVVDQGGTSNVVNIHYEKEELEGESPAASGAVVFFPVHYPRADSIFSFCPELYKDFKNNYLLSLLNEQV